MALSVCPKCSSHSFETVEATPSKSNFKLFFVQCSSCGCVVGVLDYYNIGTKLKELEKDISSLKSSVQNNLSSTGALNNNLSIINQNIINLTNLVATEANNKKKEEE